MRLNMGQIRNMININNHDELNFFPGICLRIMRGLPAFSLS